MTKRTTTRILNIIIIQKVPETVIHLKVVTYILQIWGMLFDDEPGIVYCTYFGGE